MERRAIMLDGSGPTVIADPLDMAIMASWPEDNIVSSSTFTDHSKKFNNKLLFLTVEYVDDQAKDFSRIFPFNEPVPFSSRANSPLSDFEHRVSPHDPNMSSAARYSPTPVPVSLSPFHNAVRVLQEPPSSLTSTSTTGQIESVYSSSLTEESSDPSLSQSDSSEDFTDSTSDELVSNVGNELMLMQAASEELEPSSNPLILSEISGSDLALTRDFLAMQEDQINVINSMKLSSTLDSTCNQDAETILPHDLDEATNVQLSLMKNYKSGQQNGSIQLSKKDLHWNKNQIIEDNNLWYEGCDSTCADRVDGKLLSVCTIADQPVPSRAVATLPGLYLSIDKIPSLDISKNLPEFGIFAKRNICKLTQFGPIEGILCPYNGSRIEGIPLLLESKEDGVFKRIDVSDENSSNWMRFVRPAKNYQEQNLIICQQNNGIIFLTTHNINPGEELKAGPSVEYGKRRNLEILEVPQTNDLDSNSNACTQSHVLTESLEKNSYKIKSEIHEDHLYDSRIQKKRKAACISFSKYLETDDEEDNSLIENNVLKKECKPLFNCNDLLKILKAEKENKNIPDTELMKQEITQSDEVNTTEKTEISLSEYYCKVCSKDFATKLKYDQHCLIHGIKTNNSHTCNICSKSFLNNSSLTRHVKTHQREKQSFECPVCKGAFGNVATLKDYSETHLNQDETFTCPHCPKTFNSYALTRKHARAHHFDRKHECQFCEKCFPAADKLRMHLLKHSDHREFQCANCGKQFKRKDKLKDHVTRVHYSQKSNKDQVSSNNRAKRTMSKTNPVDCDRFIYKCRRCQVGFKRRGMLVNHLAKRHPDVPPDSVPELSLPILRQTRDYYCQYCDKVYKSSSKRKAHIMKNHPGAALPPSNRNKEFDIPGLPNPTYSQAAGSIKTAPQGCQWCHKQYASKAKLLQHQRKKHSTLMKPADQVPRPRSRPPQNQNQPPTTTTNDVVDCDPTTKPIESNVELLNDSSDFECLKPRVRNNGSNGEILTSNNNNDNNNVNNCVNMNGLELTNEAQFVRVRDMR